jgi:hypothetical protein
MQACIPLPVLLGCNLMDIHVTHKKVKKIHKTPNPAHPLYGLYRFKTGFGGTLFHRMGCWDYWLKK